MDNILVGHLILERKVSEGISKIYSDAKALLEDPERWTQGASARDIEGVPVTANHSDATCWCTIGAIYKVTEDDGKVMGFSLAAIAMTFLHTMPEFDRKRNGEIVNLSVGGFNDHPTTTHADVLKLLEAAANKFRVV